MPVKKIFLDVVEQKAPESSSAFLTKERRDERRGTPQPLASLDPQMNDESHRRLMWIIIVSAGVLLVGAFGLASILAKAVVDITPRSEVALVDATFKVYPTQSVEAPHYEVIKASASESVSVRSSGTKMVEKKTTGTLTIYNTFSKQPVRRIPNTRFETPDGKIFRSHTVANIPGYKVASGKTVPGSVEVGVTAENAGALYNIGPSAFTLPGLAGSPMFESVYAKSNAPMSGGFSGTVKVVSDADLGKARSTLEGAVTEKILAKIKSQIPEDKVFFNDYSIDSTFNEYGGSASSTIKTDDNSQVVSMDGTATAVVFDKQELSTYLARRVLSGAGEVNLRIDNWTDLTASLDQATELGDGGDFSLRVKGNARFVWQVDEAALKKDLAGIKKTEYTKVFLNYPSINTAEVSISPFWSGSFPSNAKRIIIRQVAP